MEAIEEVIDIERISGPGAQISDWSFVFWGEKEIDPKLAELASGILQMAYSAGFVTLCMKVLAFVI